MKSLVKASFLVFLLAWSYRIYHLANSINHGVLYDFHGYYTDIVGNFTSGYYSFGPPITYLPFLPFKFLPLQTAETLFTAINLLCFFLSFYLLYQSFFKKTDLFFWIILTLLAFSFPLIYSLGMGNLIGIVTLGIVGLSVIKNKPIKTFLYSVSIILKIFPIALLFTLVSIPKRRIEVFWVGISIFISVLLSFLFLPVLPGLA